MFVESIINLIETLIQSHSKTPKSRNDRMIILPFTPLACALVTTTMLVLTFYTGRFYGMKKVLEFMKKEMKRYECKE